MDLTWVVAAPFLLVGVGYAFVQTADRFRVVCWVLLCASLFALSTRDLFRPRERSPPASTGGTSTASDETANRPDGELAARSESEGARRASDRPTARADEDERDRPQLAARVRGRVARWLG